MGNLCLGKRFRHRQISAREAVVPGHGILVPEGPEKSQKKCAGGNRVARGAPEELLRRGGIAGEALDLQTANHHSRRGSTKDREEAEVLDVDEGEGRETNGRAELAEGELPAQRAEKSEEAAIGKCQTSGINQSCATPLAQSGHRVELRRRLLRRLRRFFLLLGQRRQRDIDKEPGILRLGFLGWPANGNCEGKVVFGVARGGRWLLRLDCHRGCGLAALKGKFRLRFVGEGLSATRTIGLKA